MERRRFLGQHSDRSTEMWSLCRIWEGRVGTRFIVHLGWDHTYHNMTINREAAVLTQDFFSSPASVINEGARMTGLTFLSGIRNRFPP